MSITRAALLPYGSSLTRSMEERVSGRPCSMGLGAALLPTWIPVSTPLILWQVPDPAASVSTQPLSLFLCAHSLYPFTGLACFPCLLLSRHGILVLVSCIWPSFSHRKTSFTEPVWRRCDP